MTGPIDPDAPWWANLLLAAVVLVLVPAVSAWFAARSPRRILKQVAADARTSAEQTANAHSDAEFPNLRDELTATRQQLDRIATTQVELVAGQVALRADVGGLHSEVRDQRADITGIRTDARRDRRAATALERTVHTALDVAQGVIDEHHPGPQLRVTD